MTTTGGKCKENIDFSSQISGRARRQEHPKKWYKQIKCIQEKVVEMENRQRNNVSITGAPEEISKAMKQN